MRAAGGSAGLISSARLSFAAGSGRRWRLPPSADFAAAVALVGIGCGRICRAAGADLGRVFGRSAAVAVLRCALCGFGCWRGLVVPLVALCAAGASAPAARGRPPLALCVRLADFARRGCPASAAAPAAGVRRSDLVGLAALLLCCRCSWFVVL